MADIPTGEQYWQSLLEDMFSDEGFRWLVLTSESREYSANVVDVRKNFTKILSFVFNADNSRF